MGFGQVVREQPRAMLLGVFAESSEAASEAASAGADVVIFAGADAAAVTTRFAGMSASKVCAGARLAAHTETGAADLVAAGCDFVISGLAGTASAAVDSERMGQVVEVDSTMDDTTIRALAPLGLDALFFAHAGGAMTLGQQLELVRLASFSGVPLIVTTPAAATVTEFRVLRDSGTAMVVLPAGVSPTEITDAGERLRQVPAPRKQKREGRDVALVPAAASASHDHDHDDEPGEDE